jgi:hypothetical protein
LAETAVIPVLSASARADIPVFELAVMSGGATRPVPINCLISMLPIEPVPINPNRVMIYPLYSGPGVKRCGGGIARPLYVQMIAPEIQNETTKSQLRMMICTPGRRTQLDFNRALSRKTGTPDRRD